MIRIAKRMSSGPQASEQLSEDSDADEEYGSERKSSEGDLSIDFTDVVIQTKDGQ